MMRIFNLVAAAATLCLSIQSSLGGEIEGACQALILQPMLHRSQVKDFSKFSETSSMVFRSLISFTEEERSLTLTRLLEVRSRTFDFDTTLMGEQHLKEGLDINFAFRPGSTSGSPLPKNEPFPISGPFFSGIRLHHLEYFVHPKLLKKYFIIVDALAKKIEVQKGKKIREGTLWLRATSNELGHSVRPFVGDADSDGLHRHYNRFGPEHIDFAMAIKGPGTRYKAGDQLINADEGDLLIFGAKVLHGSPDTSEVRLFVTGTFGSSPLMVGPM